MDAYKEMERIKIEDLKTDLEDYKVKGYPKYIGNQEPCPVCHKEQLISSTDWNEDSLHLEFFCKDCGVSYAITALLEYQSHAWIGKEIK